MPVERDTAHDRSPLTDSEWSDLQKLLRDTESWPGLTDWEASLLDNVRSRVARFGQNAHISSKNWRQMDEIWERVCGVSGA